jgi:hypothetical protein
MVVLAIIITLTGIVFTSQSTFNKTLELANTAYDVALTLRSAETYGLGSRVTTSGTTDAGYGLHFESGASTFTLFADTSPVGSLGTLNCLSASVVGTPNCKPGDGVYTSGGDILVQTYTLGNGVTVSALNATGVVNPTSLDVVFSRPNPDAFMSANGVYSPSITAACITLVSPQGGFSFVRITSSGVITVNNATPCSS